jgi:hypothetical protein
MRQAQVEDRERRQDAADPEARLAEVDLGLLCGTRAYAAPALWGAPLVLVGGLTRIVGST